jgi:S1-C subfamily serine protease
MMHRKHFSSRTLLAGLLFAALTAALGFAQPKAETSAAATAPSPAADAGVLVVAVQPGSPAQKAGISRGDIILQANGAAVNDTAELRQVLASRAAGDTLSLKVRHGDAEKTLTVTVGTQEGRPWIGVLPLRMRDDGRFGPGMRGDDGDGPQFPAEGVLVESVAAGSPAEKAGLKKGDLILSMDGTTVDMRNPLADLVSAKKAGDTITLSVTSRGQQKPHDGAFLGVQYVPAGARGPGMMRGAFVVDVTAGGPAAKAGIEPRDVVTSVDGAPVTNPQQVVEVVGKHKPGDSLAVTVFRRADGKQTDITVTLGQNPNDAGKAGLGVSMSGGFGPPGMRGQPRTPPSDAGANAPTL